MPYFHIYIDLRMYSETNIYRQLLLAQCGIAGLSQAQSGQWKVYASVF